MLVVMTLRYAFVMTPRRTVRVDDEMWKLWETAALARGTTVSMLIRDAVNELLGAELVTFAGDVPEPPPAAAPPVPLEQPKPRPPIAVPRSRLIPDGYRCPMPNPTEPGARCIRCGEPHERST